MKEKISGKKESGNEIVCICVRFSEALATSHRPDRHSVHHVMDTLLVPIAVDTRVEAGR